MSKMLSSALARVLATAAAAVLGSAATAGQSGDGFPYPLRWYAAADPQAGQTVFSVQFDEPLDMPGDHNLQFFLADSGDPIGRVYQVLLGSSAPSTERVIEFRRAAAQGLADIVEIRPLGWTPGDGELEAVGGWGQIVSSVPFTVSGSNFLMSLPISVTGDRFVYALQVTQDGAQFALVQGVSGVVGIPAVPEPATLASMLVGLAVIGWFVARRDETSFSCTQSSDPRPCRRVRAEWQVAAL